MDGEKLRQALINESPVIVKNWRTGKKQFSKIEAIVYKKAKNPRADHQIDIAVRVIDDNIRTEFEVSANDVYLDDNFCRKNI